MRKININTKITHQQNALLILLSNKYNFFKKTTYYVSHLNIIAYI